MNSEITIDAPERPIPRCTTLTGTAPSVDDHRLWVAVRPPDGRYYLRPVDHHRDEQWETRVTIGVEGDTGQQFDVFAFYLDEEVSAYFEGIQVQVDNEEDVRIDNEPVIGYWHAAELPPDVADTPNQLVVRSAEMGECPE